MRAAVLQSKFDISAIFALQTKICSADILISKLKVIGHTHFISHRTNIYISIDLTKWNICRRHAVERQINIVRHFENKKPN